MIRFLFLTVFASALFFVASTSDRSPADDVGNKGPLQDETLERLKKVQEAHENFNKVAAQVNFLAYQALLDPDVRVRLAALDALCDLGGSASPAVNQLVTRGLRDKNAAVRARSADALFCIGPKAERAVPELAKLLVEDESPRVRFRAAVAFRTIQKKSEVAVPALIKALKDPDRTEPVSVREAAAQTLGMLGKDARDSVPALLGELTTAQDQYKGIVIVALGGVRSDYAKVRAVYLNILNDPNEERSYSVVAFGLQYFGDEAADMVPRLLQLYPCSDVKEKKYVPLIQERVITTLGRIGAKDQNTVPALLTIIEDENHRKLHHSCYCASFDLGPAAKTAIPFLISRMNEQKRNHADAARALECIGKEAIKPLTENLRNTTGYPHRLTIRALGSFGAEAKEAIPLLEADLRDPEYRTDAASALKRIREDIRK